ncbi:MAG: IS66 family transposase [Spirochaetes bacterium]|nr:IS66 family transposase [Spirochaetota bacterium]
MSKEEMDQLFLFNEAEDGVDEKSLEAKGQDKITVPSYTRKKHGRKRLSEDIPRKEVIHDLDDDEKQCPCCGKDLPHIGEEVTEELDIIPQQIIVNKHIKKKYGPCNCDDFLAEEIPEIKTTKVPERFIPGSIATPGLISYSIVSKFCDALPFYRQAKIYSRFGVDISRATLCNWSLLAAEKCTGLLKVLEETILSGSVVRMDETTVQVLREDDKKPESKSYMWVTYGYGNNDQPLLLYQYHPARSSDVPKKLLGHYSGFVQTDGYNGYNFDDSSYKGMVTHVGCLAHVRRKFEKAYKANKKSKCAHAAIKYIRDIYNIERDQRERKLMPDEFVRKRKEKIEPLLDKFYNWLCEQKKSILPRSLSGEAVSYTFNEWGKVISYLGHHLLTPDNNKIENSIRPFVIGRKNWLFSNTPRGAHSSACFYSLIESAKAN